MESGPYFRSYFYHMYHLSPFVLFINLPSRKFVMFLVFSPQTNAKVTSYSNYAYCQPQQFRGPFHIVLCLIKIYSLWVLSRRKDMTHSWLTNDEAGLMTSLVPVIEVKQRAPRERKAKLYFVTLPCGLCQRTLRFDAFFQEIIIL